MHLPKVSSFWRRRDDHDVTCKVNSLQSVEGAGPVVHFTLSDGSVGFWFLLGHPSLNPPWIESWEEIDNPRPRWSGIRRLLRWLIG
jgi:hypothetical protein